jgi:hypothetical protein
MTVNTDGGIDFTITDEEQQAVDSFFRRLEGYKIHLEIAASCRRPAWPAPFVAMPST